jgi:hypothetical protein
MEVVSARPVPKSVTVPRQEAISVPKSVPNVDKSDTVQKIEFIDSVPELATKIRLVNRAESLIANRSSELA